MAPGPAHQSCTSDALSVRSWKEHNALGLRDEPSMLRRMSPAVLADVVAIERPAEHEAAARAAVDSCNMVLGRGRCYAAIDATRDPTWYAVVRWNVQQPLRAEVKVHHRNRSGPLLVVRQVEFAANDSLEQRYRALGLLIVSHVVAEASQTQQPPLPLPDSNDLGPRPRTLRWGMDALGSVGTGVEAGVPRLGLFVRPWLAPSESSWRAFVRAGWASHIGSVDGQWYDVALGGGWSISGEGPLVLELSLAAFVQRVGFHAFDEQQGVDGEEFARWGGRLAFESGWVASETFTLLFGVEGELANPAYTVDVGGQRVGEERAPNWSAVLGLRVEP